MAASAQTTQVTSLFDRFEKEFQTTAKDFLKAYDEATKAAQSKRADERAIGEAALIALKPAKALYDAELRKVFNTSTVAAASGGKAEMSAAEAQMKKSLAVVGQIAKDPMQAALSTASKQDSRKLLEDLEQANARLAKAAVERAEFLREKFEFYTPEEQKRRAARTIKGNVLGIENESPHEFRQQDARKEALAKLPKLQTELEQLNKSPLLQLKPETLSTFSREGGMSQQERHFQLAGRKADLERQIKAIDQLVHGPEREINASIHTAQGAEMMARAARTMREQLGSRRLTAEEKLGVQQFAQMTRTMASAVHENHQQMWRAGASGAVASNPLEMLAMFKLAQGALAFAPAVGNAVRAGAADTFSSIGNIWSNIGTGLGDFGGMVPAYGGYGGGGGMAITAVGVRAPAVLYPGGAAVAQGGTIMMMSSFGHKPDPADEVSVPTTTAGGGGPPGGPPNVTVINNLPGDGTLMKFVKVATPVLTLATLLVVGLNQGSREATQAEALGIDAEVATLLRDPVRSKKIVAEVAKRRLNSSYEPSGLTGVENRAFQEFLKLASGSDASQNEAGSKALESQIGMKLATDSYYKAYTEVLVQKKTVGLPDLTNPKVRVGRENWEPSVSVADEHLQAARKDLGIPPLNLKNRADFDEYQLIIAGYKRRVKEAAEAQGAVKAAGTQDVTRGMQEAQREAALQDKKVGIEQQKLTEAQSRIPIGAITPELVEQVRRSAQFAADGNPDALRQQKKDAPKPKYKIE